MIDPESKAAIRRLAAGLSNAIKIDDLPTEFLSFGLPEGPQGLDSYEAIAVAEEAIVSTSGLIGLGSAFAARQMVGRFFIDGFADEDQKNRWLPAIARGEIWPAIAISEPNVGAHPKHLTTTATLDGNDYVLDGHKSFVTNGIRADLILALAICEEVDGRKSYGLFAVPRETLGMNLRPMTGLEALAPSSHADLTFEHCRVPADCRIGGPADAYARMALPFRDVEDAVAISGLCGLTEWLVRRVGSGREPNEETLLEVGRHAGLVDVMRAAAIAATHQLDANRVSAAFGIGARALAFDIVAELRGRLSEEAIEADDRLRQGLKAFDLVMSVARKPREARRAALGASFLKKSD
ncbi:acyl-CoA dehydrogenase family protein [Tardiphaga sp. 1201_B9_N1_1]|uniref:acyl-CoA dehydrogenase family protein n=1 Tax=unclassified Tardiphaga TaxID=2631404 RepID=UPI003F285FC5